MAFIFKKIPLERQYYPWSEKPTGRAKADPAEIGAGLRLAVFCKGESAVMERLRAKKTRPVMGTRLYLLIRPGLSAEMDSLKETP
ncbi:hypothetical protein GCM10020370_23650 [Paenibacillus hodogayensis]